MKYNELEETLNAAETRIAEDPDEFIRVVNRSSSEVRQAIYEAVIETHHLPPRRKASMLDRYSFRLREWWEGSKLAHWWEGSKLAHHPSFAQPSDCSCGDRWPCAWTLEHGDRDTNPSKE